MKTASLNFIFSSLEQSAYSSCSVCIDHQILQDPDQDPTMVARPRPSMQGQDQDC